MVAWALGFKRRRHGTQGPPERHGFNGSPESEVQTGRSQARSEPTKQKISCQHLKIRRFHIKSPNCLLPRKKIRYGNAGPVSKPAMTIGWS